ncbi:MAG TPA: hypothetical protein VIO61_01675 [Anaerolineaceae bacterium]
MKPLTRLAKEFTRRLAAAATLLLLAAACLPLQESLGLAPTPTRLPTRTVTATIQPTSTPVWFPPTVTPTPTAARQAQPTPEMRPGLGAIILTDRFTDTSQWQTLKTAAGSIEYGKGDLSIAISAPKETLLSLRKTPVVTNVYLEITATPGLCRGEDAFGVLLRVLSNQDYYRLVLTCQGMARLERIKNWVLLPLSEWTPAGIPPGSPAPVQIGFWAFQSEMRIFINGQYLFSGKDAVFPNGQIGIFARSMGDTPLTVTFADLTLRSIDLTSLPTAIPTPAGTPTRTPTATITRTLTR